MATTSKCNVRVMVTTDTLVGPAQICTVVVKPGSTSSTASLDVNGTVIWDAGTMAANSASLGFQELDIRISANDTLTFTATGTGTKAFLYVK